MERYESADDGLLNNCCVIASTLGHLLIQCSTVGGMGFNRVTDTCFQELCIANLTSSNENGFAPRRGGLAVRSATFCVHQLGESGF